MTYGSPAQWATAFVLTDWRIVLFHVLFFPLAPVFSSSPQRLLLNLIAPLLHNVIFVLLLLFAQVHNVFFLCPSPH